ncbi:hypothetical protein TSTA_045350 [Talaromyces stipitatus ATCC 10500]|uniref:Serine/arginine repetitive matrix protein 1 n=1 Tax=Talaromyces stipitatus (strain ATCC 10500 / CBS 375.48 / QM 6759 / NRRL 1006) TaxID=441959 RepID=B8MII1_TALSN|nr:uncharacterized protein TSTA_045350 [Talaromyces stipitatus ATCC 10500]EED15073.1 hypothetical protein TSTA_045350 [Talaromyces stipitatus ATCC 10500]
MYPSVVSCCSTEEEDLEIMRFEERRGGESYRPSSRYSRSRSPSRVRRPRSPPPPHGPRNRSPPRLGADTWAPRCHPSERYRSRSPPGFHRSRSPPYRQPQRARSPLRPRSPRRDRPPSPIRSWRSRSPYNQRSSYDLSIRGVGDNFRSPYSARSPRRDRPLSPPGRRADISPPPRSAFKERESYGRPPARSRSPYRGGRSPRVDSIQGNRTLSPAKRPSSGYASALNSASTSRRSSPPASNDRLRVTASGQGSRSPAQDASSRRVANDDITKASSLSSTVSPSSSEFEKGVSTSTTAAQQAPSEARDRTTTDSRRPDRSRSPRSLREGTVSDDRLRDSRSNTLRNSQDRNLPTAPSATILQSSQSRSSNVSLLSAPTRPRGATGYPSRDSTWPASPTPRRAPPTPHASHTPHGPPTGPRNRFAYSPPVHDVHRTPSYRHSNIVSANNPRGTKVNHLASLPTIMNGGRLLPLVYDFQIEKRLMNLKADEEKLVEHVVEKQLLKRQGLKDWDRLQRESALNALRSELAEIHLQRMTEEDRLEGSVAF